MYVQICMHKSTCVLSLKWIRFSHIKLSLLLEPALFRNARNCHGLKNS